MLQHLQELVTDHLTPLSSHILPLAQVSHPSALAFCTCHTHSHTLCLASVLPVIQLEAAPPPQLPTQVHMTQSLTRSTSLFKCHLPQEPSLASLFNITLTSYLHTALPSALVLLPFFFTGLSGEHKGEK